MSTSRGMHVEVLRHDDPWTIAAIAVIAFILADVGHEVLGHGIGFVIAGGRSGVFTTTRLIADRRLTGGRWRIFDLGGPLGNLLFAALAWFSQRLLRRPAEHLRLLLWLAVAFSLFWGFGYLIYSGAVDRGDWLALVPGTEPSWPRRTALIAAGFPLYYASMLLVASELRWIVPANQTQSQPQVRRIAFLSYFAAGLISCAGAIFDPRGAIEILNSGAASSFVAALGLLRIPRIFRSFTDKPPSPAPTINRNAAWITVAAAISLFYIAILGPGIKARF